MNQNNISSNPDKAGIASALLCTVHCMIVPLYFIIKSVYGNDIMQLPQWWEKLDYLFLFVSFMAVYHAASHTKSRDIKAALWVFWLMLAIAIFSETLHWMGYAASAGLISTHYINIRRMRNNAAGLQFPANKIIPEE